jgi:hypothetical protein
MNIASFGIIFDCFTGFNNNSEESSFLTDESFTEES